MRSLLFWMGGFVKSPIVTYTPDKLSAFQTLRRQIETYGESSGSEVPTIGYELPYPKHEFLQYLSDESQVVLHGSPNPHIACFDPKPQTTFHGKPVTAVFATPNAIWSMFFAIINRKNLRQYRNGCFSAGNKGRRYYYFAVPKGFLRESTWQPGMVYILKRAPFHTTDNDNECISSEPAIPIAKIPVSPRDFPFLDFVFEFDPNHSVVKTLLIHAIKRGKSPNVSPCAQQD